MVSRQAVTRRAFLERSALAAAAFAATRPRLAAQTAERRFTLNLVTFMIGVEVSSQSAANALAAAHGFESVEARGQEFAAMSNDDLKALREAMAVADLQWGAGFLPNGVRPDASSYRDELRTLPAFAQGLERAGVTRVGTWISPASDSLTYRQNFRQHVARIREVGQVLGDHGVRLGLEYIGTPGLRRGRSYPFIHSMAETKELLAEVAAPNVGFVLDSWHWWTAGENRAAVESLAGVDIVAVDLNDAPAGLALEDQKDNQRELPCATGVIPIGDFVAALIGIGYDGPVRAEPFNAALNALDDDPACAATMKALKSAMAQAGAAGR
jgi:sugar phosphate isomerase/epimerase